MPRKLFRKYLPSHESIRGHRHIARFDRWLRHPNLWHLNRDSVAGGVAAGLFSGLVPGTHLVKLPAAALLAIVFRVNLPVAAIVTLYNNPFTGVPLYILAYNIGRLIVPGDATPLGPAPEFDWPHLGPWLNASFDWMLSLGKPLAAGLPALALTLAAAGYAAVQIGWRAYVIAAWRRRKTRRRA
jgi:uncharacterized protein (DUF2062 family)